MTDQASGNKIKLHRSDTQESEAQYIAARILEGVASGKKWSDFAVLYRNNVLSNAVESAFRRNSIPYRIYKGRDFLAVLKSAICLPIYGLLKTLRTHCV